jgi:hypothetical protein
VVLGPGQPVARHGDRRGRTWTCDHADDGAGGHGERSCDRARRLHVHTGGLGVRLACNSYNRSTVAASCEIRFLAPTRLGDVLVAEAVERSRVGRDGVYDITVRAGETLVAEFVGRSKEIRGTLFTEEL